MLRRADFYHGEIAIEKEWMPGESDHSNIEGQTKSVRHSLGEGKLIVIYGKESKPPKKKKPKKKSVISLEVIFLVLPFVGLLLGFLLYLLLVVEAK